MAVPKWHSEPGSKMVTLIVTLKQQTPSKAIQYFKQRILKILNI